MRIFFESQKLSANGLAADFASFLRTKGLAADRIAIDENANGAIYDSTLIVDRSGKTYTAQRLAEWLNLPPGRISGLIEVRGILQGILGIRFVHLTEEDVVRHELVQQIIRAYEVYQGPLPAPRAARSAERGGAARSAAPPSDDDA